MRSKEDKATDVMLAILIPFLIAGIIGLFLSLFGCENPKLQGHHVHLSQFYRAWPDDEGYKPPLIQNRWGFKKMPQRCLQGRLVNGVRYAWVAKTDELDGLKFVVYADGIPSRELWYFKEPIRKIPLKDSDVYMWGSNKEDD